MSREMKKGNATFTVIAVYGVFIFLLSVLQTTILRSGSSWNTFDLRYKGSVSGR